MELVDGEARGRRRGARAQSREWACVGRAGLGVEPAVRGGEKGAQPPQNVQEAYAYPGGGALCTIATAGFARLRVLTLMPEGRIQVVARVRPLIRRIDGDGRRGELLQVDEASGTVQVAVDVPTIGQLKAFRFSSVLGPDRSTAELYELVSGDVSRLRDGCDAAILAYGPSGGGKSFTMMGSRRAWARGDKRPAKLNPDGVTALALRQIFSGEQRASVRLSVMELYNESVRDLLSPSPQHAKVRLKGDGTGGLRFGGLLEVEASSADEAVAVVWAGLARRTQSETARNENSNRSHTIVRCEVACEGAHKPTATMLLFDLAGSETLSATVSPKTATETKSITRSLYHLRRCIHALRAGRRPEYRASKLTRMLQPAVRSGRITVCVAVPSLVEDCAQRQLCEALQFGKNAARVRLNEHSVPLRAEISSSSGTELMELRRQLRELRSAAASDVARRQQLQGELEAR